MLWHVSILCAPCMQQAMLRCLPAGWGQECTGCSHVHVHWARVCMLPPNASCLRGPCWHVPHCCAGCVLQELDDAEKLLGRGR
jgi:hypothetical protein